MARYAIRSTAYTTGTGTTSARVFRTRSGARRAMTRMMTAAPASGYLLAVVRVR